VYILTFFIDFACTRRYTVAANDVGVMSGMHDIGTILVWISSIFSMFFLIV